MIPLVRELGVLRTPLQWVHYCPSQRDALTLSGPLFHGLERLVRVDTENLVKGRVRLKPDFLAQDNEQV